jgi:drug/metabolite transporter (DMT)-like permease
VSFSYILLLGILGFAVSLYFLLQGLSKIGTTNTMLILSLSSVFGLVLAAIILHEHISKFQIIAAVIMLFGIYLHCLTKLRIVVTVIVHYVFSLGPQFDII